MKSFLEDYGFAILTAIVIILLVVMATPIGSTIKTSVTEIVDSFGSKTVAKIEKTSKEVGDSAVSLTKGQIVTMSDLGLTDIDANNDSVTDTFRVLSIDGANVKLLAMDLYKSSKFKSASNNTYAGSILDTEMTNYYNTLPADVQNAIVEQNINHSTYSYSDGTNDSADFSSWYKHSFTESDTSGTNYYLTRTTEINVGNRKVFALDVDDVISYLGSASTPQDIAELFFNHRSSGPYYVWLRSAYAGYSYGASYVDGTFGHVGGYMVHNQCNVRPAFVIDLSSLR